MQALLQGSFAAIDHPKTSPIAHRPTRGMDASFGREVCLAARSETGLGTLARDIRAWPLQKRLDTLAQIREAPQDDDMGQK
jgi:hypothetical protein